jgi:hypothetical protein
MAALRIAELRRLYGHRYGHILPDDDAGRDDAMIMAHHLARRPGDARHRIEMFLQVSAPWMSTASVATMVGTAITNPMKWRADTLAARLRLTEAERTRLGIRTIGAIDLDKEERRQRRRDRDRQYQRQKRQAKGAKLRAEYVAMALSRTKPWAALGVSRRTWYRQNKRPTAA